MLIKMEKLQKLFSPFLHHLDGSNSHSNSSLQMDLFCLLAEASFIMNPAETSYSLKDKFFVDKLSTHPQKVKQNKIPFSIHSKKVK